MSDDVLSLAEAARAIKAKRISPVELTDACLARIAQEAYEATQYETFAAEEVARGRSIVGLYPATDASRAEFQRWQQGRDGG